MALGRKTKWTLVLAGVLVLLFGLLHTPPAVELMRRAAVKAASSFVGGRVSIGSLDYQLWRGVIELGDLELEPDLTVVPFNLTTERLELHVSPSMKLSAVVHGAEMVFIDLFETPSTDYTPILSHIGTLEVRDSTVRFQDHNDADESEEWLVVEGITVDLLPTNQDHRAAIHARRGRAYGVDYGNIDAALLLRPGHLHAESASIFKDDSFIRLTGELDFGGSLQGQLDADFALDGALARFIDEQLDVVGVVSGRTRVDITDGTSSVDASFASESLAWEGVVTEDIEAEANYEAGQLTLERLEASGFGGRARLGAVITFEDAARNRFELSWNSMDAAGMVTALTSLTDDALPVAARIGGEASLTLEGFNLDSATGNARVELEPGSDILGTIEAALDSQVVSIRTRDVSVPELGASFEAVGTVTTGGAIDLGVDVVAQNVADIYEQSVVPIEGSLSAQGRVRGSIDAPRVDATIVSDGLRIDDGEYRLSGNVVGTAEELSLTGFDLDGTLGSISANGVIPLSDAGSWGIRAALDGIARGTVNVFGPANDPDWSTQIVVTPTVGELTIDARKSGRSLHVENASGAIENATLRAQGRYDLDTETVDASVTVRGFRPSELDVTAAHLYGFDAVVEVDATVNGAWRTPTAEAAVRIGELSYGETSLPPILVSVAGSDGKLGFQAARDDGARVLTGTVALSDTYPLHTEVNLGALPISELVRTIPILTDRERASWAAAGTATLDVPLTDPAALVFQAEVSSIEARFTDAAARASRFTIDGNVGSFRIEGFHFEGVHNQIRVDGTIPLNGDTGFDLEAEGRLELGFLTLLDPGLEADGLVALNGTLRGSLEAPEVDGTLRIDASSGSWNNIVWSDLSLSAAAEPRRLSAFKLDATVLGGRVDLDGNIPFVAEAGAGRLEFRVIDMDMMPETADGSAVAGLSGVIDLPSLDIASWSGAGTLDRVSLRAADSAVDLARPTPWKRLVRYA